MTERTSKQNVFHFGDLFLAIFYPRYILPLSLFNETSFNVANFLSKIFLLQKIFISRTL